MEREGRARWLHPGRSLRARRPDEMRESGLSLIELVIAISVFALLAGSIAAVAGSGLGLARNNRDRSIAANLASEDIDAVNQTAFATLLAGEGAETTKTRTVGGVQYTVKRDVSWQSATSGTNICTYSAGGRPRAGSSVSRTTVTWPAMRTPAPAAVATTTVSPPVGLSPSANMGTVPVTVRDSAGNPVAGITVAATNGGSNIYSDDTDSNGCAFLLVSPSTYTVSLATANYVDRQGNASPSVVFSISSGSNVPITFDYDHPGSLVLSARPPPTAHCRPNGLPTTVAYQFFQPSGKKVFASHGCSAVHRRGSVPGLLHGVVRRLFRRRSGDLDVGARISPVAVGGG